jgi:polysaccharide export outer membrane protein
MPYSLAEQPPLLLYSHVFSLLRLRHFLWLVLPAIGLLSSCATSKYYRQRTLFQLTKGNDGVVDTARLRRAVNRTSRNYRIQPNDYLNVRVYTNKGERLIDPNGELQFGSPGGAGAARPAAAGTGRSTSAGAGSSGSDYLVQANGQVRLPIIDEVRLQGLTLLEADSVLKVRYDKYYVESFVRTAVTNNRVVILGASGGQVIPLSNDNMNLLEVLALAGGVDASIGAAGRYGGRVDNIRIIRGDLKNPQVQFIDLGTLEGMRRGNLQIEPNDVIYIQPIRRPVLETITDVAPIYSIALGTVGFFFSIIAFLK